MLIRLAPWIFVVLWSTGYIGLKAAAPYAEPMTFLSLRFALVVVVLAAVVPFLGIRLLGWRDNLRASLIGACLHGIYLGGIMYAIKAGMPAGVAALVIALQPVIAAILAGPLLGEPVSMRHWFSLAIGAVGLVCVLWPKLGLEGGWANRPDTIAAAVVSVAAITFGTLYQKHIAANIDVTASLLPQYVGATLVTSVWAFAFETREVVWNLELIAALTWLVLVLSIGAITLFLLLLQRNAAWRTSALFYLVPPVTALIAWLVFDEQLQLIQIAGMALIMGAVAVIGPSSESNAATRGKASAG